MMGCKADKRGTIDNLFCNYIFFFSKKKKLFLKKFIINKIRGRDTK